MTNLKHFFSFDETEEAIRLGKTLKKLNKKYKIEKIKNKVDTVLEKVINFKNDKNDKFKLG